ncbi:MAG: phosphotransferase family protein [Sphingomonadales bacterium]|nr:phosphotransferase family protein [Sphingomonadales bacterium]MBK6720499.1 phosphotransferase family protein [Sphingomonadales bacterium]MBK8861082.1 phosphotransferase family protein [Sphingomonadales bacterium]MBL0115273.1 phosphotransferase family protein [Sphingomonadales bacterium]
MQDFAHTIAAWLSAQLPGVPPVEIVDTTEPAQGFSSRTILFTARWREEECPLVARIQRDVAVPMLADVFHQHRVMTAIAANSAVKVPIIAFTENDPAIVGAPFFIMERLYGRVPSDFPSYHQQGWFADLPVAERTRCWWNGVEEMARLHRIDWRCFPFLSGGTETLPDAVFYLDHFVGNWFEWARNSKSFPVIEDALTTLKANAPPAAASGLVWNDARLGNTMYESDGTGVVSLLDFEVATLGPPEVDLAHWVYLDEIFSENFGVPRIDGLPRGPEAVAGFEHIYGRAMPHFSYYMAVAALKILILSVRSYANEKHMGAPAALPDFLVDRLAHYLAEFKAGR